MGTVESLDLSLNQLSCVITQSMVIIALAKPPNMSYNDLSGTVPLCFQLLAFCDAANDDYLCCPLDSELLRTQARPIEHENTHIAMMSCSMYFLSLDLNLQPNMKNQDSGGATRTNASTALMDNNQKSALARATEKDV